MTDLAAGQVLGRYELLLPIAKGGMAQVWAARLCGTRGFKKIVAIKTILDGAIDDTRMEQMFLAEAQLASQIHHPNVVGTMELGEQDNNLYLVMEWVDGEPLNYVMARATEQGGMPLAIAVNLIGQACKGLHAAHDLRDETGAAMGVVHRDISPQNVLVTYSGTAKLVDFGIAKATARSSGLTEAGEIKGKFAYMSPEQVCGSPVDRRTDIFAMGILLYLLTTGRHPFRGDNPAETLQNICSKKSPARPSSLVPGYPPDLEAVVMKALSKAPEDRWSTANDMLCALESAVPNCLEGSFEVQVAEYLNGLLGHRGNERRQKLRLAQEVADRSRLEGALGSPGSYSSLRAIALDPSGTGSNGASISGMQRAGSAEGSMFLAPARWFGRPVVLALSVVAVGLIVGASLVQLVGSQQPAPRAASPVPSQTYEPPPLAAPAPSPAPIAAPVATAPSETEDSGTKGAKSESRSKKGYRAPVSRSAAASPAQASASAPQSATSQQVDSARAGSPEKAIDAWDPGTFGGRR